MARMRTIKPEFFKDAALAELPIAARMFFAGLWCQADREGRLRDEPKVLKLEIAPWDDDVDAEAMLSLLAQPKAGKSGFIIRYEVGGFRYIHIPHFADHQRPYFKEKPSKIPPPVSVVESDSRSRPQTTAVIAALSLGSGQPDPRSPPPPPEAGGATQTAKLRLKKRNRPTTLEDELVYQRDRIRNERSKMLHDHLRQHGAEGVSRDEQLLWVQERCRASPEESADVVTLVEQALAKLGGVRNA
jgi:hypothetical protein